MENLTQLRKRILSDMEGVAQDKITIEKAKTICIQAQTIINLTRLEMDYIEKCEVAIDFLEAETDIIKEIEESHKEPYEFQKPSVLIK